MRIVVALGGNALLARGEKPDAGIQEHHVRAAVRGLLPLLRAHELVITHGNGPQVGLLAMESANDSSRAYPYPLDVLTAQTQGMIGYWLVQALAGELPGVAAAGVITRTLVSATDPAFEDPQKFVGTVYDEDAATRLMRGHGWSVKGDGDYWRRVVPSPAPVAILEMPLIRKLVDSGIVPVCAGGGGIPVKRDAYGFAGVEAVVDKDFSSALVAEELGAHFLLLLTDVANVFADYGSDSERPVRLASPASLRSLTLPHGSMGAKVEAACRFVERTGGVAGIGALEQAESILEGRAGTVVTSTGTLAAAGVLRGS